MIIDVISYKNPDGIVEYDYCIKKYCCEELAKNEIIGIICYNYPLNEHNDYNKPPVPCIGIANERPNEFGEQYANIDEVYKFYYCPFCGEPIITCIKETDDMRKIDINDIKISEEFKNSNPSEDKIMECKNNFLEYNKQDRYVVVNREGVLIDGYIAYLAAKELGIKEVEVKFSDRKKKRWHRKNIADWDNFNYTNSLTTYVYGTHPNDHCQKERVWRVPKSWENWGDYLCVDDKILVETSWGVQPIIVSRIEKLSKSPVGFRVKKVAKKRIKRGGKTII